MKRHNHQRRLKMIIMSLLLLTATFGTARAATDSHSAAIDTQTTNWTDTLAVAQFDPSLGALTSVEISFSGCVAGSAKYESLDAAPTTVTLDLKAEVALTSPIDGSDLIVVAPLVQQTDTAEAHDGAIDFGGGSGNTFDGLSNTQSGSTSLTTTDDLAAFTGSGTIEMPVTATGMSTGSGAGNLITQFATDACAQLQVDYIYEPASATIGNLVWSDTDGNGLQGTDETGVGDVTVNLLDARGTLLDTTTTIADGSYSFTVDDGTYIVEFVAPTGQNFTGTEAGDDALDSDANVTTGQTAPITISAGENNDTIDAGLVTPDPAVPSIAIDKGPDGQTVPSGSEVTFDITVTNDGENALYGVTVTDPLAPNCDNTIGDLAIGESVTYQCTLASVTADFINVANVIGQYRRGSYVEASDEAPVIVAQSATIGDFVWNDDGNGIQDVGEVGVPDVTVNLYDGGGTLVDTTTTGSDGSYNFTVNAGDYVVEFMAPNGSFFTSQDAGDDALDSDADTSNGRTATISVAAGDNNDTIDAGLVTANPRIAISKEPDLQTVYVGDVTFTITVDNMGNVDLSNVTVTDTIAPECDNVIGDLAVGASVTYDCTTTVTDDIVNVASITGNDDFGNTVMAEDDAIVDVIHPSVAIVKGPDMQTIESGGTATFDITVTNDGDVDLTNVTVSDLNAPACDNVIGDMAVGESVTYQCTLENVPADFTNTAKATGTDPLGGAVEDEDDAAVDATPIIAVEKIASRETVPPSGGYVEFEVIVSNISGEEANITSIIDNPYGDILDATNSNIAGTDCTTFALAGNESTACGFTVFVEGGATGDVLMDIVTVAAEDDEGNTVTDSDTESVTVVDGLGTGTPGYWKNHHEVWSDIDPVIVGDYNLNGECDGHESCLVISNVDALYLLDAGNYNEGRDKRYTLWRSLITAWLNLSVGGNDFLCIQQAIDDGIFWLNDVGNPMDGGEQVKGRQWSSEGEPIYEATDEYNNTGGGCAMDRDSGNVSGRAVDYSPMNRSLILSREFTDIFLPFLASGR